MTFKTAKNIRKTRRSEPLDRSATFGCDKRPQGRPGPVRPPSRYLDVRRPTADFATSREQPARGHPSRCGPRCARGPQHPRATHGPSTHEASALDGGHGRPGTAEPAGVEVGRQAAAGVRTANAAPPGRARPSARKPQLAGLRRRRVPRDGSRVPPPATPRAAGSQTALPGRTDLGAAVPHTFARSSRAR